MVQSKKEEKISITPLHLIKYYYVPLLIVFSILHIYYVTSSRDATQLDTYSNLDVTLAVNHDDNLIDLSKTTDLEDFLLKESKEQYEEIQVQLVNEEPTMVSS